MVEASGIDRDTLVLQYQGFVHQVVGSLINAMNLPPAMAEEYVSAGYLGLVEAAERFDFSQGKDFKSFAYLRIRGSIIDSIRRGSNVPGYMYSRYVKAWKVVQDLREELYQKEQVSEKSGSSSRDEQLAELLEYATRSLLCFRLSERDYAAELTGVADHSADPAGMVEQRQHSQFIRKLISQLPEKERTVIEQYYFQERSFADIADHDQSMSKSWVSRLHARALKLLKEAYCEAQEV